MNTQRSGQSGKSKCSARSEMEIPGGLWSIECHEAWGYEALSLPPDRTPLASEQRQHDLKKLSCFSYHHQDFFLNPTHHSRAQPFDPGREKTGLKFTDCPPVFYLARTWGGISRRLWRPGVAKHFSFSGWVLSRNLGLALSICCCHSLLLSASFSTTVLAQNLHTDSTHWRNSRVATTFPFFLQHKTPQLY